MRSCRTCTNHSQDNIGSLDMSLLLCELVEIIESLHVDHGRSAGPNYIYIGLPSGSVCPELLYGCKEIRAILSSLLPLRLGDGKDVGGQTKPCCHLSDRP